MEARVKCGSADRSAGKLRTAVYPLVGPQVLIIYLSLIQIHGHCFRDIFKNVFHRIFNVTKEYLFFDPHLVKENFEAGG